MKKSKKETAQRFDDKSAEYDDSRSKRHMEAVSIVVDRAMQHSSEVDQVVDLGAGTGMVTLEIAPHVDQITGLDISEGMLTKAREKAEHLGIGNVEFARGSFRKPEEEVQFNRVDLLVSNFAMHHLDDEEKREAIRKVGELLARSPGGDKRWFVLGDVIKFEKLENPEDHYSPDVDDPATIEFLVNAFEEEGFVVDEVIQIAPAAGVFCAYLSHSSD